MKPFWLCLGLRKRATSIKNEYKPLDFKAFKNNRTQFLKKYHIYNIDTCDKSSSESDVDLLIKIEQVLSILTRMRSGNHSK